MTVEVSLGFTCIGVLALLNLSVKKVNIDSCSGLQTEATPTSTLNVVAHGDLSLFFSCFVMKTHPAGTVDIAMDS